MLSDQLSVREFLRFLVVAVSVYASTSNVFCAEVRSGTPYEDDSYHRLHRIECKIQDSYKIVTDDILDNLHKFEAYNDSLAKYLGGEKVSRHIGDSYSAFSALLVGSKESLYMNLPSIIEDEFPQEFRRVVKMASGAPQAESQKSISDRTYENISELSKLYEERMSLIKDFNRYASININWWEPINSSCDEFKIGFSGRWCEPGDIYCSRSYNIYPDEEQHWVTGGEVNLGDCETIEVKNLSPNPAHQYSDSIETKVHMECVLADDPETHVVQDDHFSFAMRDPYHGVLKDYKLNREYNLTRCRPNFEKDKNIDTVCSPNIALDAQEKGIPTRYDITPDLFRGAPLQGADKTFTLFDKKAFLPSSGRSRRVTGFCDYESYFSDAELKSLDSGTARPDASRVPRSRVAICGLFTPLAIKLVHSSDNSELYNITSRTPDDLIESSLETAVNLYGNNSGSSNDKIHVIDTNRPVAESDGDGVIQVDRTLIKNIVHQTIIDYFGSIDYFDLFILDIISMSNEEFDKKSYGEKGLNWATAQRTAYLGASIINLGDYSEYVNTPTWTMQGFEAAIMGQLAFVLLHEEGHVELRHQVTHATGCEERKGMERQADKFAVAKIASSFTATTSIDIEQLGFVRFFTSYDKLGLAVNSDEARCAYDSPEVRLQMAEQYYAHLPR